MRVIGKPVAYNPSFPFRCVVRVTLEMSHAVTNAQGHVMQRISQTTQTIAAVNPKDADTIAKQISETSYEFGARSAVPCVVLFVAGQRLTIPLDDLEDLHEQLDTLRASRVE